MYIVEFTFSAANSQRWEPSQSTPSQSPWRAPPKPFAAALLIVFVFSCFRFRAFVVAWKANICVSGRSTDAGGFLFFVMEYYASPYKMEISMYPKSIGS